jgi:peroxiredoxin
MPETNTSDTLKVGDRAPDFSLSTANAPDTTSLSQLLAHGPAVLEFLRGTW